MKIMEGASWKIEAEELVLMILRSKNLNKLKEVTLLNYPQFKDESQKLYSFEEWCVKQPPQGNLDILMPSEIILLISEYLKNEG